VVYNLSFIPMSKKRKTAKMAEGANDLWVAPRMNLRGQDGNRAWDNAGNISPNSGARFLELADIALGLKKPESRKKKSSAASHQTTKKEPYSS
jgi:hypothetical protein